MFAPKLLLTGAEKHASVALKDLIITELINVWYALTKLLIGQDLNVLDAQKAPTGIRLNKNASDALVDHTLMLRKKLVYLVQLVMIMMKLEKFVISSQLVL